MPSMLNSTTDKEVASHELNDDGVEKVDEEEGPLHLSTFDDSAVKKKI